MKIQSKVKILELTLDRYNFTSHGLHLNSKGKKAVSQNLALVVKQFFNKDSKPSTSIPIPWKDPPLQESTIGIQHINEKNKVKNLPSPTYHRRYCPTRRNPDFL